jgi:hypothetical protein
MFTASGLLVRFLKVFEKSNYQSVKWVRYMTKANSTYQIRVSPTQRIISSYSRPDPDHHLHTPVLASGIAVRNGSVLFKLYADHDYHVATLVLHVGSKGDRR